MSDDLNLRGAEQFLRSIADASTLKLKVGILGKEEIRRDNMAKPGKKFKGGVISRSSNAEIGMAHEFGDPDHNLPARSFIRMPLHLMMQKTVDQSGALGPKALKLVMEQRSVKPWLTKIGVLAENIISDAFDTGGFGRWIPSNFANKTVHQTLVETQQLRRSITSEVTG